MRTAGWCSSIRHRARGPRSPSTSRPRGGGRKPHDRAALHSHRRRRAGDPRHPAHPAQERGLRRHDGAGRQSGARAAQGRRPRPRPHRHQDARRHRDRNPRGREGAGPRNAGHPDDGAGFAADRHPGGGPGRLPLRAQAVLQRRDRGSVPARGRGPPPQGGGQAAPAGGRAPRAVLARDGARQVAAGPASVVVERPGEMSAATQVKLLRVLQEREAIPVGGTETIPVDVRVIAATNRDLEEDIKRGRFRTALYYRLNVIAIHLPPLRERPEDIPELWEHVLERVAKERGEKPKSLSEEAKQVLLTYDWPGNVRELENVLERAVVLTKADAIDRPAMPEKLIEHRAEPLVSERLHANPTLDVIERAYITWVLQSEGGNKTRAAEVLGIDPSTLYRKLGRYEVGEQ